VAVPILASPYDDQEIDEVDLGAAPLVRVLAQIRHPSLAVLVGGAGTNTALRIAERLSKSYPIFQPVQEATFLLSPEGVEEAQGQSTIWRLGSADEVWQVSLNKDFLSIETKRYEGRLDFLDRFRQVLMVYSKEVSPPAASRVGIRYTNRIEEPGLIAEISRLVRPELLGPVASRGKLSDEVNLLHAFSQARYAQGSGGLIVSWGLLPPDGVIDVTLSATSKVSWILDIDSFDATRVSFDVSIW